jgi:hypothetical protein
MANLHPVGASRGQIEPPPSGLEHVHLLLDELDSALEELLAMSGVRYHDINASSHVVFIGWNNWQWSALPDEAAPRVGRAREALRRLREFASNATRRAPDRAEELAKVETKLERVIEQPNGTYPKGAPKATIEEVREHVASQLDDYRGVLGRLPAAHGDRERLLVPDTSALLDRPNLQSWKLDGTRGRSCSSPRFTRSSTSASVTPAPARRRRR